LQYIDEETKNTDKTETKDKDQKASTEKENVKSGSGGKDKTSKTKATAASPNKKETTKKPTFNPCFPDFKEGIVPANKRTHCSSINSRVFRVY